MTADLWSVRKGDPGGKTRWRGRTPSWYVPYHATPKATGVDCRERDGTGLADSSPNRPRASRTARQLHHPQKKGQIGGFPQGSAQMGAS